MQVRSLVFLFIVPFGMISCAGGPVGSPNAPPPGARATALHRNTSNYVTHIVVVIQENRSFDDLFATFPGADGATQGLMKTPSGDVYVSLQPVKLKESCDFSHGYHGFLRNYDAGKMDGFGLGPATCHGKTTAAYQYVEPSQIGPYWDIAQQYVLGDQMFQTQGSGSFTAHQDLIAGATTLDADKTQSIVDLPSVTPWGCDAPPGTRTDLLVAVGSKLRFEYHKGPFPCLTYSTLRDLLDAKSMTWKYYSPPIANGEGRLWNAFDAIKAVRDGPEWGVNVVSPETQFFTDIQQNALPAVSWIVPNRQNSDHPAGPGPDTGPSWIASIVNAIGESSYWPTTAVVVVWDDWGGFYDHVPPPFFDQWGGLGFRVPLLVVSPYAREAVPGKPGYISHTQYEFGSILRFIEDTFNLGSLGTTDARATSIGDCFDFTQPPRQFQQIPSSYSKAYFIHQAPSYQPVDTE
jgi:phospholipase C